MWVRGAEIQTLSKTVAKLPFQNSRFYHQSAVRFMLRFGICTYADLGVGFR